ncbi:MAG: cytochrome c [Thiolinea sp.]
MLETELGTAGEGAEATADTAAAATDDKAAYASHLQCEGDNCKIDKYLTKGFRAFGQCQVCHGIDGNGSTIAPSLMLKIKQLDKATFYSRVENGYQGQIGVMPPWKDNPNVMNNLDSLYDYLNARADGKIPAGKVDRF